VKATNARQRTTIAEERARHVEEHNKTQEERLRQILKVLSIGNGEAAEAIRTREKERMN
jgi:hypothetical protein